MRWEVGNYSSTSGRRLGRGRTPSTCTAFHACRSGIVAEEALCKRAKLMEGVSTRGSGHSWQRQPVSGKCTSSTFPNAEGGDRLDAEAPLPTVRELRELQAMAKRFWEVDKVHWRRSAASRGRRRDLDRTLRRRGEPPGAERRARRRPWGRSTPSFVPRAGEWGGVGRRRAREGWQCDASASRQPRAAGGGDACGNREGGRSSAFADYLRGTFGPDRGKSRGKP